MCRNITEGSANGKISSMRGYEVEFDASLNITVRRIYGLDSDVLTGGCGLSEDHEIVPVFPIDRDDPTFRDIETTARIEINSLGMRRESSPVPPHTLSSMLGDYHYKALEPRYLAVSLTREEYTSFPTLGLTVPRQSTPRSDRFRLGALLPASHVHVTFSDKAQLCDIRVIHPPHATVDLVALRCALDWSKAISDVDNVVRVAGAGTENPAAIGRLLYSSLSSTADGIQITLDSLLDRITDATSRICHKSKPPHSWTEGVLEARAAITEWRQSLENFEPTIEHALDAASGLRNTLAQTLAGGTDLIFPAALDRGSGVVDLSALERLLASRAQPVYLKAINIPFTTEREPETQGRRSALALVFLGAMLLMIAFIDLSWLPLVHWLSWLPNHDLADEAQQRERELREPVAIVLLIFPAALYGQFFQSRPRTDIGTRAQIGTFAALSVTFALPIIPAGLIAIGAHFSYVSMTSVAVAVLAIIAGVTVWLIFSPTALHMLRRREIWDRAWLSASIRNHDRGR